MDLLIRKILAFAILSIIFAGCGSSGDDRSIGTDMIDNPATLNGKSDKDAPEITFEETEFITGKITQGEIVDYVYKFENTGNAPLIISSVSGSCGCTVTKNYPTGKIMPGEGGEIEVEFDSDNKWGEQNVTISVATNAIPAAKMLYIKTNIVVPDNMKTSK